MAWDAGGTNSYRMGAEGKYDLMLGPSHDPDKLRKDPFSPRPADAGKSKMQSVDSSDSKNKVTT